MACSSLAVFHLLPGVRRGSPRIYLTNLRPCAGARRFLWASGHIDVAGDRLFRVAICA